MEDEDRGPVTVTEFAPFTRLVPVRDRFRGARPAGVPTLVIIDGSARTVSLTGREDLNREGIAACDDWMAIGTGG